MDSQQFSGQVAVVTGGAQGLGFAVSRLMAERGASVYILDNNESALASATAELKAKSFDAVGIETDVSDERAVISASREVQRRSGKAHVLVNNAGWFPSTDVMAITEAEWDKVFAVNTKSVFFCTREFGKAMVEAGYGRIVSVVSSGAYGPNLMFPHYAAAKAALISIIRTFALKFAAHEVLVNGVSPGNVATAINEPFLAERIPKVPLRRAARPEEIAEIIAFLASRQNSYIVGETIIASGGFVMA